MKKRLREKLQQNADVWQIESRRMPCWIRGEITPTRPSLTLVVTQERGLVLASNVTEAGASPEVLWEVLATAMKKPMANAPHRPTKIQVRPGPHWDALKPHLEEIGITLETTEQLELLDEAFNSIPPSMMGEAEPSLLDQPGITPELARNYYEAAATFFRETPWKHVGYESAIRIECNKFKNGVCFGVVMGLLGISPGLATYENLEDLRQMWSGELDPREAEHTDRSCTMFGEAWDVSAGDVDNAEKYSWPLARPDAYPQSFHVAHKAPRWPTAAELIQMEACLRAVPGFVRKRRQDDPTPEKYLVRAGGSDLELTLSWLPEGERPIT